MQYEENFIDLVSTFIFPYACGATSSGLSVVSYRDEGINMYKPLTACAAQFRLGRASRRDSELLISWNSG